MKKFRVLAANISLLAMLAGCSATTTFQAEQSDVALRVNQNQPLDLDAASSQTYSTTTFGQYIFEAEKEGQDPMYGLMPLKFNGGYLVADILFFAPATFFNLREVFPYYEFDLEEGVVRYKKEQDDPWVTYTPTSAEIERARNYFGH